jgi:peptidyl-tRNA hydrolase, PTH2 family
MIKQVIILRKDLNMRKGKMVAQGAHASLDAAIEAMNRSPEIFKSWIDSGMTKIVVGVNSLEDLLCLYTLATDQGIVRAIIQDAGRTEFKEPTMTAVALGPCETNIVDTITGNLKLL